VKKNFFSRLGLCAAVLSMSLTTIARATPTPQTISGLSIVTLGTTDFGSGEITVFTVNQAVVAGCTNNAQYVVRDPNMINAVLAILTSSLVAGRTVDIFVSGACDSATGEPLISSVTLH
jgi:hypothetical protein